MVFWRHHITFKMKNIIKLKKQKNNMKKQIILVITILTVLISFSIVNASMYDNIALFKGRGCEIVDPKAYSGSTAATNLINQFGLTTTPSTTCRVVLDTTPYSEYTQTAFSADYNEYAEVAYAFNDAENLLILGKDSATLNEMIDVVVNYETYEYYLKTYDEDYPYYSYGYGDYLLFPYNFLTEKYDPTYTGPEDQNCVDNPIENVYLGNQGSYQDGETVQFSSSCVDANKIEYGFCFVEEYMAINHDCECVSGKCIATPDDIFYYFRQFYQYAGPSGRIIDYNLINSAISSWINN